MFVFDVESVGTKSNSIILSAAICYFDSNTPRSFQALLDNTLFVKFNVQEQAATYNRKATASTLDWWAKQSKYVQSISFEKKSDDLSAIEGVLRIKSFIKKFPNYEKDIFWARGTMDQSQIDDLCESLDEEPIATYNQWRDVRTVIDILYNTTNGYCDIENVSDYHRDKIIKHHPAYDVCLDAAMILWGKPKNE